MVVVSPRSQRGMRMWCEKQGLREAIRRSAGHMEANHHGWGRLLASPSTFLLRIAHPMRRGNARRDSPRLLKQPLVPPKRGPMKLAMLITRTNQPACVTYSFLQCTGRAGQEARALQQNRGNVRPRLHASIGGL